MRVAVDPETGEIVAPTAEQRRGWVETASGTPRVDVEVEIVQLRDGTRIAHLGEGFMQYSIARLDDAGRIQTGCVPSLEEAMRALHGRVPASRPPAVEK
jgi:hypothetical protein